MNYQIYSLLLLSITNIYQLTYKRLVHNISITVILLYVCYKCIQQTLNIHYVMNEYLLPTVISLVLFKSISKHNLGLLLYRYIQITLYIVIVFYAINISNQMRDTKSLHLIMIFQHITYIVKRMGQFYLKDRLISNLYYDEIYIIYIRTVL